jgi:hypothetical protein
VASEMGAAVAPPLRRRHPGHPPRPRPFPRPARPASAATLPAPSAPSLPLPVGTSVVSTVADTAPTVVTPASPLPTTVATAATSGGIAPLSTVPVAPLSNSKIPAAPLPITRLSIPTFPVVQLPVVTMPITRTLTGGTSVTGAPNAGPVPGTGEPAHAATGSKAAARHTASTLGGLRASLIPDTPGAPVPAPGPRVPSPSFPSVPSSAGDSSAPGHGNSPGNAVPLTILVLAAIVLGGVSLRRRLPLTLLFDSRLTPPG